MEGWMDNFENKMSNYQKFKVDLLKLNIYITPRIDEVVKVNFRIDFSDKDIFPL